MSLLRRALRSVGLRVGKDRYLVGTDLEGNAFYERPHPEYPDEWRKNKRYVEYRVTRYLSDYNFHTIPVQWSSWLRRTRRQPPTLNELELDYSRQLKLQENVQKLELEYREEKLRLQHENQLAISGGATGTSSPSPPLREGEEVKGEGEGEGEGGLPKDDVGIGKREVLIGKNLGIHSARTETSAAAANDNSRTEPGIRGGEVKTTEEIAQERRDADRDLARKRREEFARNAPPTGNPSDSFQPQAWSPAGPAKRR